MLRKLFAISFLVLLTIGLVVYNPVSSKADGCSVSAVNGGTYQPIGVSVSCETTSGESQGTDTPNVAASGATGCFKADGTEVDCWFMGFWWSSTFGLYCHVGNYPPESPLWDEYRDSDGKPHGTLYECLVNLNDLSNFFIRWANDTPVTPAVPGTDPETLVRQAVVNLGLHPPEAGVSAYIYPGYEDWGLTWWVGAPMWLWTDDNDDLQWGTHHLTDTDEGLTVDATVTSTSITFDPGNEDTPVTCDSAGTPRPWNPNAPLAQHSPSGCDYTYMDTNTLGDKDSRFTVTATVTWTVTWSSSDGQYGTFTSTTQSSDNPAIHIGELRTVLVPPK